MAVDSQGSRSSGRGSLVRRLSLQNKLLLVIMTVSLAALFVSTGAFALFQLYSFNRWLEDDLSATTRLIAENVSVSLAFGDPVDARSVLASLESIQSITGAALYGDEGILFAEWKRDKAAAFPPELAAPPPNGIIEVGAGIEANRRIELDGKLEGTLVLRSSQRELAVFFKQSALALAAMVMLAGMLSLLLSRRLLGIITEPVVALAKVMEDVARTGDYGERAVRESEDELGMLAEYFNGMLDRIQGADRKLRASEERYYEMASGVPGVIYQFYARPAKEYGFYFVSDRSTEILGLPPDRETFFARFTECVSPDLRKQFLKSIDESVENCRDWQIEVSFTKPAGEERWLRCVSSPIRRDGELVFNGVIMDVTEQKRAEANQTRLAAAVEQADEDVIITARNGTILYVNPAFERLSGYTREEALGQNPRLLNSGLQDKVFYRRLWKTISGGNVWRGNIVNRRKNGEFFTQDATISPIFGKDGSIMGYVSIRRDITEHLRLEEQLLQSQKMEAIGTLAGGIAHDFNNILAAIMGFTELAKSDTVGNEDVQESLAQVEHAGERARDLVAQILAFSRQSKMKPVAVKPKEVVSEVLKLLRASLPTTVEIRQDLDSDSSIVADPTQLHQVLMNLCTNAAHAMREEGGTLSVSLGDIDLGTEFVAGRTGMAPGRHLLLTVGDTGHGMTAETVERIFDPFFTTKPKDEGTGMGLSVVHGIVRKCGGAITVESRPGEGTEFSLFFPLAGETKAETGADRSDAGGGTERILFVDDEEIQGDLAEEGLGRLGYRVTAVNDPEEALELFQVDPRAFDLVVTDMTMPKMTGDILAKRIMLARKDIPVILSTGFSERIDEGKTKAMGIRALVFKPVVTSEMARIIRNVLDGGEGNG
jgi:PAS domain S-box-containing protein